MKDCRAEVEGTGRFSSASDKQIEEPICLVQTATFALLLIWGYSLRSRYLPMLCSSTAILEHHHSLLNLWLFSPPIARKPVVVFLSLSRFHLSLSLLCSDSGSSSFNFYSAIQLHLQRLEILCQSDSDAQRLAEPVCPQAGTREAVSEPAVCQALGKGIQAPQSMELGI